jgi:hypothetical protein
MAKYKEGDRVRVAQLSTGMPNVAVGMIELSGREFVINAVIDGENTLYKFKGDIGWYWQDHMIEGKVEYVPYKEGELGHGMEVLVASEIVYPMSDVMLREYGGKMVTIASVNRTHGYDSIRIENDARCFTWYPGCFLKPVAVDPSTSKLIDTTKEVVTTKEEVESDSQVLHLHVAVMLHII